VSLFSLFQVLGLYPYALIWQVHCSMVQKFKSSSLLVSSTTSI
jgi:hypothetical protein